jgi:hypothetical protein
MLAVLAAVSITHLSGQAMEQLTAVDYGLVVVGALGIAFVGDRVDCLVLDVVRGMKVGLKQFRERGNRSG